MFYPTGNNTKGRMLVCISDIEPELDDKTCDCDDNCLVECASKWMNEKNYCVESWQLKDYLKKKGLMESRIDEDMDGGLATLDTVGGMGLVEPPTRTSKGSGDKFGSVVAGSAAAKNNKKKRLMKFSDFNYKK
jgi:hypothetical protein